MSGLPRTIDILDTTLRDGAQARGITFSVGDKLNICQTLDELGVAFIEAGNPASNPKEAEFFQKVRKLRFSQSKLAAFGSTRHKSLKVEEDPSVQALLSADTEVVVIFGKAWDLHAEKVLGVSLQQNLDLIGETLDYFRRQGRTVFFDAEHFFDGYRCNADYAMEVLRTAHSAGAQNLVLCDTNGGTLPDGIADIVTNVDNAFSGAVGIHCHDDSGMAVANSVVAVQNGAAHVQGTMLGYGERCGNASLSAILPTLQLKLGYQCLPDGSISNITTVARTVAEISNVILDERAPYVGHNAFAHKGGMHIDGVTKLSRSFEHIDPAEVGNERQFLLSEVAGRSALAQKIGMMFPDIDRNSDAVRTLTSKLKELEHVGYQFEGAEGSFELFVRKHLAPYEPFFHVDYYKCMDELPDETGVSAFGTVRVDVDGRKQVTAGEGDGPVHALDQALRHALETFYPSLSHVHLTDYRVRVLDSRTATASRVRVVIESTDGDHIWTTVGVSTDVIHASMLALIDSMEFKLLRQSERSKT